MDCLALTREAWMVEKTRPHAPQPPHPPGLTTASRNLTQRFSSGRVSQKSLKRRRPTGWRSHREL